MPEVGAGGGGHRPLAPAQSRCCSGISSRNREGGLYEGCPQALRIAARVR
ncbi:hypothetical protein SCALM49S_00895 [Streptomyces californicus]